MDRYNLLDEDDFFSQLGSNKEEKKAEPKDEKSSAESSLENSDESKQSIPTEEPEELILNIDDEQEQDTSPLTADLVSETAESSAENETEDLSAKQIEDEQKNKPAQTDTAAELPEASGEFEETVPEEESSDNDTQIDDDYYVDDYYLDAQQTGVNTKPILITIGVIILLIIAGFVLYNVFSGNEEETAPVAEEKVKEPSPEELHRLNALSAIANNTQRRLTKISEIMNLFSKKTKITSVYLYGEDFIFEVYCSSRDELGKFNMKIRENYPDGTISLKSSQVRPGTKGGIFGVYAVSMAQAGASRDTTINFDSEIAFEDWIKGSVSKANLTLTELKNTKSFSKDVFKVIQYEGLIKGDYQSCLSFINSLKLERKNIEFYKLAVNSRNLKNFSSKYYQLSFIIRLYL